MAEQELAFKSDFPQFSVGVPVLESGVAAVSPRLAKQGRLVVCNLTFTGVAVGTGYIKQLTIPDGFRPRNSMGVNTTNGKRVLIQSNGEVFMQNPTATTDDRITVVWEIP